MGDYWGDDFDELKEELFSSRYGVYVEDALVHYLEGRNDINLEFYHNREVDYGEGVFEIDFVFPGMGIVWEVKLTERENSTWQAKIQQEYANGINFDYIRSVGREAILADLKRIVPPRIGRV
jgi:hypothetical protein